MARCTILKSLPLIMNKVKDQNCDILLPDIFCSKSVTFVPLRIDKSLLLNGHTLIVALGVLT